MFREKQHINHIMRSYEYWPDSTSSKKNPVNIMFDGIERLRYDHEIQFIEKRCAFISMGSKMLYNMLTLYCPGVWSRPGLDHERVSVLSCSVR